MVAQIILENRVRVWGIGILLTPWTEFWTCVVPIGLSCPDRLYGQAKLKNLINPKEDPN